MNDTTPQTPPLSRSPRLRNAPEAGAAEPPSGTTAPGGETLPPPAPAVPEPPMIEDVQPAEPAVPPADEQDRIPGSDLRKHDVVQVIDPAHRHYGVFFIVGDVKNEKVHGYYMAEGYKKEFITVPLTGVFHIFQPGPDPKRRAGTTKVRARADCSPKWISDNK